MNAKLGGIDAFAGQALSFTNRTAHSCIVAAAPQKFSAQLLGSFIHDCMIAERIFASLQPEQASCMTGNLGTGWVMHTWLLLERNACSMPLDQNTAGKLASPSKTSMTIAATSPKAKFPQALMRWQRQKLTP